MSLLESVLATSVQLATLSTASAKTDPSIMPCDGDAALLNVDRFLDRDRIRRFGVSLSL